MTTGEGGAIAFFDDAYLPRIQRLRFHGIERHAWKRQSKEGSVHIDVAEPARKANFMDLQAAIGLPPIKQLDGSKPPKGNDGQAEYGHGCGNVRRRGGSSKAAHRNAGNENGRARNDDQRTLGNARQSIGRSEDHRQSTERERIFGFGGVTVNASSPESDADVKGGSSPTQCIGLRDYVGRPPPDPRCAALAKSVRSTANGASVSAQ